MTENWLEYDWKMITMKKKYFLNLTEFHDTNEHNLTPKKYAGADGLDRSPSPGIVSIILGILEYK